MVAGRPALIGRFWGQGWSAALELFLFSLLNLLLLVVYWRVRPGWRHSGPYLPDAFLFANLLFYALGAVTYALTSRTAESRTVMEMALTAMASGTAGAILFAGATRTAYAKIDFKLLTRRSYEQKPDAFVVQAAAVMGLLGVLWFLYSLFTSPALSQFITFENIARANSLVFARTAISQGTGGYMAPGFIAQFRDTLLPIVLCTSLLLYPKPFRKVQFVALLVITIAAMVFLGARSNLIFLVLSLSLSFFTAKGVQNPGRKLPIGRMVLLGALLLSVWVLSSFALGRTDLQNNTNASVLDVPVDAVSSLLDRVIVTVPRENVITFDVWHRMGPTGGEYWTASLGSIFKSNTPQQHALARLSSYLSWTLSGGLGDSPLGTPADVWLAWGWIGLIVVPMLYCIGIGIMDLLLLSENSLLFFGMRMVMFFATSVFLSPYLFLLYGGAAVWAIIFAFK